MMIPKRIFVTTTIAFVSEFFEGPEMAFTLQKINHATTDNPVDEAKDYCGFLLAITDNV